ncbi:N-acetylglucosamine-6-sulfatase isoform X2 [Parasteatoda tepidariorum]|uniref:N-acetylglucosamine-6-sulfatase isoform X2 n=1 Tax=Parasteatoda tepidariorum TaxID=114398 RepID=UPI001C720DBC|nr:N-acetylglucosamine-6-sulfatase isoform X2 [Parasteatoda tepidariorum]
MSFMKQLCFLSLVSLYKINCDELPNFVFILTDDQDIALGGMFVTTPLCCPSRASILTGKYAHNHGVRNNSLHGNCNSKAWQKTHEQKSFITQFKKHGYSTFYAGKYLNQYGTAASGGVKHIPPGWDQWVALVGNSCYYNYSLSVNGEEKTHGSKPEQDYLTNVVFEEGLKFLHIQNGTSPFFMFLSPPAPHAPFTPFPPYKNKFSSFKAPRTPNFAIPGGQKKHWLIQQPPTPLPKTVIDSIDDVFQNRWRTLLSVDDYIIDILQLLENKNMSENTYIIFSSDNGFHLGQFSLPWDKRQLYDFDIRVPLFVSGPGIKQGIKIDYPVLNIDLAPTFLDLANIPLPKDFDGESFAPLLRNQNRKVNNRQSFIIEHQGEYSEKSVPGCPQYQSGEVHTCEIDCICEDSRNNTFSCLRHLTKSKNFILCIFKDDLNFGEAYNILDDPFQLKNIYFSLNKSSIFNELKTILKF